MERRILPTVASLIGTVAGAFGFSKSVSFFKVSDNSSPSHTQNVWSIEPVEVSYKCGTHTSGNSISTNNFKIKLKKDEIEKNRKDLMEKKEVKVRVEFEFESDSQIARERESVNGGQQAFMIAYGWGDRLTLAVGKDSDDAYKNYRAGVTCKLIGDRGVKVTGRHDMSEALFYGTVRVNDKNEVVSLDKWSGNLTASELNCRDKGNQTTTCDLKLSYSSNHKWNAIVSEKLKSTSS